MGNLGPSPRFQFWVPNICLDVSEIYRWLYSEYEQLKDVGQTHPKFVLKKARFHNTLKLHLGLTAHLPSGKIYHLRGKFESWIDLTPSDPGLEVPRRSHFALQVRNLDPEKCSSIGK